MMRLLGYTLLALVLPPAAYAQMASTRIINFVDTPATITYDAQGEGAVQLHPTLGHIIRVAGYRKVSICVGGTQAKSFQIVMGKLLGATLGQAITRPINNDIHAFDIIGPHLALLLTGGSAGATEKVQLWVFLSS